MKQKSKFGGNLSSYLRWPLLLSPMLIIMNVHIYTINRTAGLFMSAYLVIYLLIAFLLFYFKRTSIMRDVVNYAVDFGQVQRQILKELDFPYAILDLDGRLLWANHAFLECIDNKANAVKSITNVIPELTPSLFPELDEDNTLSISLKDKHYQCLLHRLVLDDFDFTSTADDLSVVDNGNTLITLYLYDETEVVNCRQRIIDQRMIVGLLYIDNYEESLESIDEVRRSLLTALIDRKINKYMQGIDAIIKKLEKDKYIFMFRHEYLPRLQDDKFSILEDIRTINVGNEIAITLSIGLGISTEAYAKRYEYSRTAIDLALGRGGDQVVLKSPDNILYYGGKSIQVEKNTRVKARVKAHALRELAEASDQLMIMGHSISDVDSFGSAIGIYRIAQSIGKSAHIVINDVTSSIRPLMDRFKEISDYEDSMFITGERAKSLMTSNTLLVVVDVNKPSYTECPELLLMTKTIVILDHHRQAGEGIENPVLSYIESYASSACEMVAEILQYIGEGIKLRPLEADAMYSGIMIDTNNFVNKTGVRTFEAVAFLRRNGADVTRIRKMFRCDMIDYKLRAEAIHDMELFLDNFALTICQGNSVESPTILGAQVANSLLDITGIKASFVLTPFNNKIYISARSIDEVNVHIIMEKFGGGGHMNTAGAQLEGCTLEEAKQQLIEVVSTMQKEGDL